MDETTPANAAPLSDAVFRVARLHRNVAAQLLRDTGLRPGQELVLMTLWSEGPQRLVDLVRTLGTDAPTMTRSIARLEKAGLVARSRSPLDARAVIVEATAASRPLRPKVEAAWARLEQLTAGSASARRQDEILRMLTELESRLTRTDPASDEA